MIVIIGFVFSLYFFSIYINNYLCETVFIINIVTCHLGSQPIQRSLLGNTFVNTQQYCRRC
jgi:hypothetical protein